MSMKYFAVDIGKYSKQLFEIVKKWSIRGAAINSEDYPEGRGIVLLVLKD
jgi:hypothetical protein